MSTSADLDPEDVKAALHKSGHTLSGLSQDNDYHHSAAGKALRVPWPAVERLIAGALGKEPREIWPSRYDAEGNPYRERRSHKITTAVHGRHVQRRGMN